MYVLYTVKREGGVRGSVAVRRRTCSVVTRERTNDRQIRSNRPPNNNNRRRPQLDCTAYSIFLAVK